MYWMKRFTIFVMLLLVIVPVWSKPREERLMIETARAVLCASGHQFNATNGITQLQSTSAYTIYGNANSGGFVMIAVDDRLPAVLAVSASKLEDSDKPNPGFEWYCSSVEEVARLLSLHDKQLTTTLPDPDKYPRQVDALLTTKWGQDDPFSYCCPTSTGEICDDYRPDVAHCCVGCVATALAQIMYYYRYPAKAAATCDFMIGDQQARASFDASYDWENMLEEYGGQYTEAQGRAVAQLCYHCGLVSSMNYGTDSSGSSNLMGLYGAQEIFGYSTDARTVVRDDYDEPSWMDMVYSELSQRHPLYYQGIHINFNPSDGTTGVYGHSFVIDGYNEQGLVHVNWGWYGNHDGYYNIAILDVRGLQFNAYQDMVIGLVPGATPGDVNGDGRVSIDDVTTLIDLLLTGSDTTTNPGADVNGDGRLSIDDVTTLIDLLLTGGAH